MTDLKYSILGVFYNSPSRQESKANILNLNLAPATATSNAIADLIADRLIKHYLGVDKLELTALGVAAYEQANEERSRQAEQKRQQRFDNKISVASVLVPLITFFLGIIIESRVNVVDWFLSLFK